MRAAAPSMVLRCQQCGNVPREAQLSRPLRSGPAIPGMNVDKRGSACGKVPVTASICFSVHGLPRVPTASNNRLRDFPGVPPSPA